MEKGRTYEYDPVTKELKPTRKIPRGHSPRQLKFIKNEKDPGILAKKRTRNKHA
tara:strand:- start:757 stop:918 length:162 start_codon:yes stop_codon:yes gene_type:complete